MNIKIISLFLVTLACTTTTAPATTALHYAAQTGNREDIKRLIAFGFDINAKDEYGWQPLHYAAFNGHRACVEELLQQRATIFSKDNHDGHYNCILILVEKGAPLSDTISSGNLRGNTPETLAALRGHNNLACLLSTVHQERNNRSCYGFCTALSNMLCDRADG